MKLRIIAGEFKGSYLTLPEKKVGFRPTQERVRQALAEIIKERIPDAVAADFCAGSGAFGFELISRGARMVHFVDNNRDCAQAILQQARRLGVEDRSKVFVRDIGPFVQGCSFSYDIIFYDPPYENAALAALAPRLLSLLSSGGTLIHEFGAAKGRGTDAQSPAQVEGFCGERRRYGDTLVDLFYRP